MGIHVDVEEEAANADGRELSHVAGKLALEAYNLGELAICPGSLRMTE